ncbi:hypothetical protein MDA_GLEAN10024756 [Myotis davidii]|uniref:Uncharacterized protein n=1 Tax=Myotis davidii TaxID=225400 RepID=L5LXN6_MYODS|nr:hypothetical protein MDA_GLEAN10024756 [Myotis davidii]
MKTEAASRGTDRQASPGSSYPVAKAIGSLKPRLYNAIQSQVTFARVIRFHRYAGGWRLQGSKRKVQCQSPLTDMALTVFTESTP